MLAITTTLEHIGHWTKMRQSLARFSGPESSPQTRSLADFIATTSGFRFSVHTGVRRYERAFLASRDKIGRATADESSTAMRAWALPAESRPEWRSSLRSSIGGDGLMMCRS